MKIFMALNFLIFLQSSFGSSLSLNNNCKYNYFIKQNNLMEKPNGDIGTLGFNVIEEDLKKKEYNRVYDIRNANLVLEFEAFWLRGPYVNNGTDICGEGYASVKLIDINNKNIILASKEDEGTSGYFCNFAKKQKVVKYLKEALKVVPNCVDLNSVNNSN